MINSQINNTIIVKAVGLPKINEEKMIIENSINTTITPKPFFDMNILELDGKTILKIKVYKGDDGWYEFESKHFSSAIFEGRVIPCISTEA